MEITPDQVVYFQLGPVPINATIVFTWLVMLLLTGTGWLVTRRLEDKDTVSRWQSILEVVVLTIGDQIRDVSHADPGRYLPFIGTLFLFIASSNTLVIVPGFHPPTGSLSTTTALGICVFFAVPIYAIATGGVAAYLRNYLRPTPFMLPFNVIGEFSRTVALAVRLYGNIMSGTVIVAILIGIVPFFFPVVMEVLGLLTGVIQAYIFAILAMVYIASAARSGPGEPPAGDGAAETS